MLSGIKRVGIMTALGVAAVAAGAEGQEATGSASPAPGMEASAVVAGGEQTVASITARIQAVQQQALRDPVLSAANREISQLITATLPRVDPNYPAYAQRAQTLRTDVATAQAAGDNARLRELAAEATTLQANITSAQNRAKEDPGVKAKLEEFRGKLFAKMVEIEPTVRELVERLDSLQSEQAAQ